MKQRPQRIWVIVLSFLAALMLTAMPLPEWAAQGRPFWVAMVLIYWCMALPQRVGVFTGWSLGLLVDVLTGALLGQHAASLAVVAYLTLALHQRVRVFPLGQQALAVGLILCVYLAGLAWVRIVTSGAAAQPSMLLPVLSSMLLWPWLFIILRDVRRRLKVT